MRHFKKPIISRTLLFTGILVVLGASSAFAAITDLSSSPVSGKAGATPAPNVMLLMDTSKSMGFTHMPDDLEPRTYEQPIGYRSAQCNALYYDPSRVYKLPTKSDGTARDQFPFTSAPYDVYASIADTRDLSNSFRAFDRNTRSLSVAGAEDKVQAAYYYVFVPTSGNAALNYKTAPCTDSETLLFPIIDDRQDVLTANTTGGQWQRRKVGSSSGINGADERQNFANWYTYYRTRMLMMKSAISTAFSQQITNKFRIGFVGMNPLIKKTNGLPDLDQGVDPAKYLQIDDFSAAAHRFEWFSKLASQVAEGSSPAREGLARVGRHFAGKTDGINLNMAPDPMGANQTTNTCRQNFTIMTTDGYWNTIAETRGPVKLDGTTLVGQQDGNLTPEDLSLDPKDPTRYTQRPMWDGATSGTRKQRDRTEQSQLVDCNSGTYFKKYTTRLASTSQSTQRTQSLVRTTDQYALSTAQTSMSTSQMLKSTASETRQTLQNLASTQQSTKSTRMEQKTTTTYAQNSRQYSRTTVQVFQTNTWVDRSTTTRQSLTVQYTRKRERITRITDQNTFTDVRTDRSTRQLTRVDTTNYASTTQPLRSTSQVNRTTTQQRESTSQTLRYDGASEQYVPTPPPCASSSCITLTAGPTPVASCTPQTASSANNYLSRTCDTAVVGPTPVASCSVSQANSGNSYTATSCNTVTTVNVPVPSCSNSAANSGNGYTVTTCTTASTGPTAVASCTPGTNSSTNVTTTCSSTSTAPVGVSSCTPGTNASTLVTTSCPVVNTGPTPVASCNPSGADGGNNYVATTCTPVTSGPTGIATCTPFGPTASNNYTTRSCASPHTETQVASCTPGTSGTFVKTTCSTETIEPLTGIQNQCTSVAASAATNWISTTCNNPSTTAWVTEAGCTAITGSAANNYVNKQCQDKPTSGPTPVLASNCSQGTVGAVTTTCTNRSTGPTAVASCVPNTVGPTLVSCTQATTGPTIGACTPGSSGAPNYIVSTCTPINGPPSNVAVCVPQLPNAGNNYTETVCTTNTNTVSVAPGTCVAQSPTAGNNQTTITCPVVTTGPVGVPLNSCTPVAASLANGWVGTTCANVGPTAPTPVASCTNTSGTSANNYVVTTCSTNNSAAVAVTPGSCTNAPANSSNSFTQTLCTPTTSSNVPVAAGTCTNQAPNSSNGFVSITCTPANTGPTFVELDSCTPGTDGDFKTTTCSTLRTGPTLVAACTPGSTTDGSFKVTTCTDNKTSTALAVGSTCSAEAASASNNWTSTTCTLKDETKGVNAPGACTPSAPGALTVVTCGNVVTPPTPVAACTPGIDSDFKQTFCDETNATEIASSCTAVAPTASNGYQEISCEPILGKKVQTRTTIQDTTYTVSGTTTVGGGKAEDPIVSAWTDVAGGTCYLQPQSPPVIDTSWHRTANDLPQGCTEWPCTLAVDTTTATSGSVNSLADVAQYYYVTDLRPEKSDNVNTTGSQIQDDRAPWQHMTTFVVGLGVNGTLKYEKDYQSSKTGDFFHVKTYGDPLNWPNWPDPKMTITNDDQYNDARSIDDFWHTAVNGRGKYFSATDPDAVAKGLAEAFATINGQDGAGSGATTSSPSPIEGDNTGFTASFKSEDWSGDVEARDIDVTTAVLSSTLKWSAQAKLDGRTGVDCDNRTIYTRDPVSGALLNFAWDTYVCNSSGIRGGAVGNGLTPALKDYFSGPSVFTAAPALSQLASMSAAQLDKAKGANLVNFLRGQRAYEDFAPGNEKLLYRRRGHVLGDIVGSQPAYVRAPNLSYQDVGYAAFKEDNKSRASMLYVGANDGMLHAFDAVTGDEAWAFVPTTVMANMWRLADASYSDRHVFSVDGSPTAGDVYDSSVSKWKTILVGGLNNGGAGYYALDVSDPAAPKPLWEFTSGVGCSGAAVGASSDCNLGQTYGRPVITKLANKKWVVMVTSGYNNVTSGNGGGYLYVLDAITGKIISRIATGAGSTAAPSGLKDINFFVANGAYDNTALRVYGGDLLGNIWRFDVNDTINPPGLEATLLGTARDASGKAQPITTRVELAEVNSSTMVIAATGRLLGTSDLTDQSTQSIYALKDPLGPTEPAYSNFRTSLKKLEFVQTGQFPNATRTIRCAGSTAADCSSANGWYVDLPDAGERINVDVSILQGTLVFASNVPSSVACTKGGYSWLNFVNLVNGEAIPQGDTRVASVPFFSDSLVAGLTVVTVKGQGAGIGQSTDRTRETIRIPTLPKPPLGKRISWREIIQ